MTFAGCMPGGVHPGRISSERGFTMIATHNVKVNGRWYAAGEEVPDQQQVIAEAVQIPAKEESAEEKPVEQEAKPKTAARRKASK